jgi:hypothetical protein
MMIQNDEDDDIITLDIFIQIIFFRITYRRIIWVKIMFILDTMYSNKNRRFSNQQIKEIPAEY